MTLRRSVIPLVAFTLAALLAACAPGAPGTPGDEAAEAPAATEPGEVLTDDTDPAAELRAHIIEAMSVNNPGSLQVHLAPTVHVTYAASEMEGDVTDPAIVIYDLAALNDSGPTWDFDLPDSVVENYANNPGTYPAYADDFPTGAIVGRSSDDKVVSFTTEGSLITRVFVALNEYDLTFE